MCKQKEFYFVPRWQKPSEILFFTHFEKDKGECIGELKGTARFVSSKKARLQGSRKSLFT